MNLSVAVSENWGIGNENKLLFRIPDDLQRFKELTTGKVVVMGRNTYESLPASRRPLPNRVNIVLSRNTALDLPGVIICHSINALRVQLENYSPRDVFIIGGGELYTQMLDYCETAYITKVQAAPSADCFFPDMEQQHDWRLVSETEPSIYNGTAYTYCIYTKAP